MTPAFLSTRQAAIFGGVLMVLLTLPVTLYWTGLPPTIEVYRGMSERAGPFDYMRRQVFEVKTPLDIAFVGSSLIGSAISTSLMQSRLSEAIGRPAEVRVLRQSWQGPDMNYFVARDLLENRKVGMLVLSLPARVHNSNRPHVQLFRLARLGDYPGAFDGLDPMHRAAIYADFVLGAPRQLLTRLRRNQVDPNAGADRGQMENDKGYLGRPFVRREIRAPRLTPESLIYSDAAPGVFRFDNRPLNDYQFHFVKQAIDFARSRGIFVVLLHLPSPSERGFQTIPERGRVAALLGPGVALIGLPAARMFENAPDETFLDFFEDEHVNANGGKLYTASIAPAIIQLYEQFAKSN
jgi:hypothetical protein